MAVTEQQVIAGLYAAFFNRAPDAEGLSFWDGKASADSSLETFKELAAGFATHSMFSEIYDSLSNQQFVEKIFINVLGSSGDTSGVEYWTGIINGGTSRSNMVAEFVVSALNINLSDIKWDSLTAQEKDIAQNRQDTLTNKAEVGITFVENYGDATNIISPDDLDNDVAYQASISVLSAVDHTADSVIEAESSVKLSAAIVIAEDGASSTNHVITTSETIDTEFTIVFERITDENGQLIESTYTITSTAGVVFYQTHSYYTLDANGNLIVTGDWTQTDNSGSFFESGQLLTTTDSEGYQITTTDSVLTREFTDGSSESTHRNSERDFIPNSETMWAQSYLKSTTETTQKDSSGAITGSNTSFSYSILDDAYGWYTVESAGTSVRPDGSIYSSHTDVTLTENGTISNGEVTESDSNGNITSMSLEAGTSSGNYNVDEKETTYFNSDGSIISTSSSYTVTDFALISSWKTLEELNTDTQTDGSSVRVHKIYTSDADGNQTVTVETIETDSNGNITTDTSIEIISHTGTPQLVSSKPTDGQTDVFINQYLLLEFDEYVALGSGSIELHLASDDSLVESFRSGAGSAGGTISGSGQDYNIGIDLGSDLEVNTDYYLTVSNTAIVDTTGEFFIGITGTTDLSFTSSFMG